MPEPWDQQPGETPGAYRAFVVYLELGITRTLDAAYRSTRPPPGPDAGPDAGSTPAAQPRAPGSWKTWYRSHKWKERAGAFDRRDAEVAQTAREKVIATVAADRAGRMLEQEQREHELAGLMFAKIKEMLETGLVKRKVVKGEKGEITVLEPCKWGFSTVARLADVYCRLGRISLNMPVKVEGSAGEDAPYFETSGQMENALGEGQAPPMPADTLTRPPMPQAAGTRAAGMIQPRKPPRPDPPR